LSKLVIIPRLDNLKIGEMRFKRREYVH
jgi:hypothetical protein